MLRKVIGKAYKIVHNSLHKTLSVNPLFPKTVNGKPVGYGFISNDHLADPSLDDKLVTEFTALGIETGEYQIDIAGYRQYLAQAGYPETYHGGGQVSGRNFEEKTLEHYVSADLLQFSHDDVYVDIASDRSPFAGIVRKLWEPGKAYRQDLSYPAGIHGDQIGGDAGNLPLPDNSISKATLHCSLEHFEGETDQRLFREMGRVLKPGGVLCILPFYLAREYTIHTDPVHCFFFGRDVIFDPEARIRYCNWTNRHSRHYDPAHLQSRILANLNGLVPKILRVTNFRDVHPSCYLRFIGMFTKQGS